MNNKKLGTTFLVLSIIIAALMVQFMTGLRNEAQQLGCYQNAGCMKIESNLTISHAAFGIIGFIFALGFYLIFFSKGEEALLKRIEQKEQELSLEQKFGIMLKGLDDYEKKVMNVVKEQPGITQNTLRLKTSMSKAKLSYVLSDLEKKGLVRRITEGKTLAVHAI